MAFGTISRANPSALATRIGPLSERSFRLLFSATTVTTLGDAIAGIAKQIKATRELRRDEGYAPQFTNVPLAVVGVNSFTETAESPLGGEENIMKVDAGVQDEGSQLVTLATAALPVEGSDRRWLDLCAGPGGKAALLASIASSRGARLTANEITPHRAELVRRQRGRRRGIRRVVGTGHREFDRSQDLTAVLQVERAAGARTARPGGPGAVEARRQWPHRRPP